ncbi:type II toxin-antitoxin system PrlF family antitoxin [Paeniroseomonas aquatica]|uniref:type II toxin-antitoxin system PrlF family antitoxin n=1 Tax=Paeniroseomonas aquatica TaxID=373043 RepID=UPI0036068251
MTGGSRRFSAARASAGNSEGIRIEKAFFKAAPEFDTASTVTVDLIGPGKALISVTSAPEKTEGDPVISAWLSFVERDIQENPGRLMPLAEGELTALEQLVNGVVVGDSEEIPDDVIF